jgi:hypothetical protein
LTLALVRFSGARMRSSTERLRFAAIIYALPNTEFRSSTEIIISRLMGRYLAPNWFNALAGPSVLIEYKGAMETISSLCSLA